MRDFLSLSVEERNLAVDLSSTIKREMMHHVTLKALSIGSSWDNLDVRALLNIPQESLSKILVNRRVISRNRILKDLNQLYVLMGSSMSIPEVEPNLDHWIIEKVSRPRPSPNSIS